MKNSWSKNEDLFAKWLEEEIFLSQRSIQNQIYISRYLMDALGLRYPMLVNLDDDLERMAKRYVFSDEYQNSPKYTERHIMRTAKLLSGFISYVKKCRHEQEEKIRAEKYLHPEKFYGDETFLEHTTLKDIEERYKARFGPGRGTVKYLDEVVKEMWQEQVKEGIADM